jgi:hypothetical protein
VLGNSGISSSGACHSPANVHAETDASCELSVSERLEPEKVKGKPLCTESYKQM